MSKLLIHHGASRSADRFGLSFIGPILSFKSTAKFVYQNKKSLVGFRLEGIEFMPTEIYSSKIIIRTAFLREKEEQSGL